MNIHSRLPVHRVARQAMLAFALSSLVVHAQTAPAPAAPRSATDETIVLTPFTVDAQRDVGFVAASALAGGRLATDLKDTPVAYSVLTREFIDALGLTDISKASAWVVNSSSAQDDGRSTQFGSTGFSSLGNFRGVR